MRAAQLRDGDRLAAGEHEIAAARGADDARQHARAPRFRDDRGRAFLGNGEDIARLIFAEEHRNAVIGERKTRPDAIGHRHLGDRNQEAAVR